jgi:hypothetical protein
VIAIDVLKWPGMNTAFLTSLIGTLILIFAPMLYGKRRPTTRKSSWGEAMLGGTYVFGVMFLAFGVVPHQWIDHADRNLGWDKTKLIHGPGGILKAQAEGGWMPFTLQYQAVRDIIVVVLHAIFFGLIIFMWHWWQTRDQKPTTEIATSVYGRPLVKKA